MHCEVDGTAASLLRSSVIPLMSRGEDLELPVARARVPAAAARIFRGDVGGVRLNIGHSRTRAASLAISRKGLNIVGLNNLRIG